jgi:hypothetical protein
MQNAEELNRACQGSYDFVVVDVGLEHIVYALREIRADQRLQNTSVFVRAERLVKELEMTSVFAKYRARPCLDLELMELVPARLQEKDTVGLPLIRSLQERRPVL